ncbi:DUF3108 domain-containing protein [Thauera sinica]|uniref:DUF3108 domain-containing protein n=1 Tax=Thauera sinica TaxID=2665146 RepID=A0ABW1AM95_9RHOO|nr:DUF3108 domain-containing protein [Thauera sp. K11]ATE59233.1 hypothetical protein CCZ27_04010 [Thauera sp. K11]
MMRRTAIAALGISVLLHGALLAGGDLAFAPRVEPELPPVMQARLIEPPPVAVPAPVPPAPAAAAPQARPVPKPRPPAKPKAPPAPAPVALAAPTATQSDAMPDAPSGAAEPSAPVPEEAADVPAEMAAADEGVRADAVDAEGWPDRGSIVFRVFMGDKGFEVGQARHQWSHDEHSYRMETLLQTTGLVGLMRSLHYVQRSEGELGPQGLKPLRFTVEQGGKRPESAEFDWAGGRVSIRRDGRERRSADIRPGDQDVLSLWHQIGIVGAAGLPKTITVVSNKGAKPALLEAVGSENARLPIGRLDTLHLRAQASDGSLTIDIWLAKNYGMLPVRIRLVDGDGESLDQQAIQLRLAPPGEEAAAAAASVAAAGEPEMIELKEEPRPAPGLQEDIYRN